MADIKWIKLTTNIFENRKIRQIECLPDGDSIVVIWVKLLCLAGNINDGGCIYLTKEIPYTDQMLATQFNRPLATVQLALQTFAQFGMIEIVDNILCVSNWERYQNVEGMEKIREQTRARVAKHREKQKLLAENVTCNVTVTGCNATDKIRKEEDIDKKKDTNVSKEKAKRFSPPTIDDIKAYCLEKGYNVDAERFADYYNSNGWMVGRNKMKDWKATVRNWSRNSQGTTAKAKITTTNEPGILDGLL